MKTSSAFWFALLLFTAPAVLVAEVLGAGEPLPAMELPDQHGNAHALADAAVIVFAPDKAASEIAHPVLEARTDQLQARGIVYVTDISAMPGFVTRMFALPKMRDYGYTVLLGREAGDTGVLPRQEGRVTVLRIAGQRVGAIRFAESAQALAELLDD